MSINTDYPGNSWYEPWEIYQEYRLLRERAEKAEAERDKALDDAVSYMQRLEYMQAERDAYKRAKEENDDRFMAERDLLWEFMRDVCAVLKCEENDEAALLAIDELCVERDKLREALEKIASGNHTSTGAIMLAEIARAALEGKP